MEHCEKESWLSGLLDSELTGAQRIELEAHLQQCARCRELLGEMRILKEGLRSVPLPEPAQWEARWRAVSRTLEPQERKTPAVQPRWLRDSAVGTRSRWALALAACLLALLVGFRALRSMLPSERPIPGAPTEGPSGPLVVGLVAADSWEVEIDQSQGGPGAVLVVSADGEVAVVWVAGDQPDRPVPEI